MRFGIFMGLTNTTWDEVLTLARHCDETGWDAFCVTDHFMPNTPERTGDSLECWTALAALAHATRRIRVGTIVSGNTYRHPAVLAKMATNVDIISGGRLLCGMGAGWQENEHRAYGLPFYTVGERLQRLDEACQILKLLWTQDKASFKGRFYQLDDAPASPKPVQRPHPELMVGGGGEKVTLKVAAKHADHWNVWGGPEILRAKGQILDQHCAAVGRNPKEILRSGVMVPILSEDRAEVERGQEAFQKRFGGDKARAADIALSGSVAQIQDKLGRLRDAGVGMVFIPSLFMRGDKRPLLDRLIGEVAPALR